MQGQPSPTQRHTGNQTGYQSIQQSNQRFVSKAEGMAAVGRMASPSM